MTIQIIFWTLVIVLAELGKWFAAAMIVKILGVHI